MPRPISDEERAEIAKLYNEGWAKKRIARKIGRAPSTVADVLGAEDRGARRQRESERRIRPAPARPIGPLPVADTGWFAPLTRDQLRAGK